MVEARQNQTGDEARRANARIVAICLFLVVGMSGMAYAAVPLYDLFCRVTGYGGTTQRAENSEGIRIIDREITVRFDANVAPGLGLKFRPEQREVTLRLGEVREIHYIVENPTSTALTGTATYNVTPQAAGVMFNKLSCFCFTETRVEPGETIRMPVVFFVDPELVDVRETRDVRTLTLSYTFFPVHEPEKPVAATATEAVVPGRS